MEVVTPPVHLGTPTQGPGPNEAWLRRRAEREAAAAAAAAAAAEQERQARERRARDRLALEAVAAEVEQNRKAAMATVWRVRHVFAVRCDAVAASLTTSALIFGRSSTGRPPLGWRRGSYWARAT